VTDSLTDVAMVVVELALRQYLASPSAAPFDISVVPTDAPQQVVKVVKAEHVRQPRNAAPQKSGETYAELLAQVPELSGLGVLFASSKPVELTESETEYTVSCIKHVFPEHVVFQVRINSLCSLLVVAWRFACNYAPFSDLCVLDDPVV